MGGLIITVLIYLSFIIVCESILWYRNRNGVMVESTPSIFIEHHINVVVHIMYKGKEVRRLFEMPHISHSQQTSDKLRKRAIVYYKAYVSRVKKENTLICFN